jgi:hypothetical protein
MTTRAERFLRSKRGDRLMTTKAERFMRSAAIAFAAGYSVHALDHLRRGLAAAPPRVFVVGALQGFLVVTAIVLVLKRRPRAARAAMLVGFGSALLFTYGHLVPGVSIDSYVSAPHPSVTWFSWVTAFAEIGTGIVFGVAGLRARPGSAPGIPATP